MSSFTTARLLDQVGKKASLPTGRYENSEILDTAYDILLSEITPMMVSYREEYYIKVKEYSIAASQQKYRFPSRALGQTLREVKLIKGSQVINLERIQIEDITSEQTGTPDRFFVQSNDICLYPTPNSSEGTLRLYYHIRPSKLVETTEAAQITAIDTGTNTLSFSSVPTSWTTSDTFDLIEGRGGYEMLSIDLQASSVTSTEVALSSLPSELQAGDWVALAGESPFPYLPAEAHNLLVHLTAASLLEDMGDQQGLQSVMSRAGAIRASLEGIFSLRIEGAPKALTTPLF